MSSKKPAAGGGDAKAPAGASTPASKPAGSSTAGGAGAAGGAGTPGAAAASGAAGAAGAGGSKPAGSGGITGTGGAAGAGGKPDDKKPADKKPDDKKPDDKKPDDKKPDDKKPDDKKPDDKKPDDKKPDDKKPDDKKPDDKTGTTDPSTPAVPAKPAASLSKPPFILKAFLWKGDSEKGPIVEGNASLTSQTLLRNLPTGKTAETITLAQLRRLLPDMSRFASIHGFCTASGTLFTDDNLTLKEYFDAEPPADANAAASINVYYRSPAVNPTMVAAGTGAKDVAPAIDMKINTTPIGLPTTANGIPSATALPALTAAIAAQTVSTAATQMAGKLTEDQWSVVLRNCGVFYGWIVDRDTNTIKRAPKAAFQLRRKADPAVPTPTSTATAVVSAPPATDVSPVINPAATNADGSVAVPELPSEIAARLAAQAAVTATQAALNIPIKSDKGIPNYRVNDDSKIDIAVCKHQLAISLAKNDFSSSSTEASVSGGAFGVTVGVSAGYAKSQSSASTHETDSQTQTMVARYMFPRCDIFMYPDDLEPTPELATLIDQVRRTKSITALRKLQSDFGQFFCQQLTLGARLLSTRTTTTMTESNTEEKKEEFKVSVGVSVSAPFGSASMKHEETKGSGEKDSKTETNSNDTNVFEATGGDTILASNPIAWTASVASPELWRVINRDALSPLMDMLSVMPGFEGAQRWFIQAVPALSRYLVLDDTRKVTVRFKVQAPTNDLHVSNIDGLAVHYLAHTQTPVRPQLNDVSSSNFWYRTPVKIDHTRALFEPNSWRAPVLRGFAGFDVGGSRFGASYNADFAAANWNIIAPFSETLGNGNRVILQNIPYTEPVTVTAAGGTAPPQPPISHMIVFRTAQGEFVPAMSDRDEYQYWRILKVGSSTPGEPICPDDDVRLCWSFKDQDTGYRDFVQDSFGRRQSKAPAGLPSDILYLKVPWPRFDASDPRLPTTMIMSTETNDDTTLGQITTRMRPTPFNYMLQDLRLRINQVENGGKGDSNDYLLRDVSQQSDAVTFTFRAGEPGNPFQMWARMWQFGV